MILIAPVRGRVVLGEIDIDVTGNKKIFNPNIKVIRSCILE
jgi:hypothetical protein